ncbi:HD domain-containing protein [Flavobacteriaceae bacterium S356]|uniref:HD domain-containing protein n=1 Tax=Asprobacillus argus TaxID=3076534 RepID=A0ABU3LDU6_9FLAO|nr:HD domain-containing protein [Flavobacteriaceae bacterium S356]
MKTHTHNKLKILNDPIYGFIRIPNSLIFDIIEHPYFQRLRRISQMGLSNLVYPGANHTRFHHAVGCMDLMQKTVRVLRVKGIAISEEEEEALCIAILLHDIGHGPFSHALEHSIVNEISHEEISLLFMINLNKEFGGKLSLAIEIFTNKHSRKFLHQLISSQLDIDRLDYLKRDSFYTGVTEGNISSDRLIAMMNVVNDELVIEKKGIYSVEKFLIARRLMYWQVYLHKTGLVAENMMVKLLQRAKELTNKRYDLQLNGTLNFFLNTKVSASDFSESILHEFSKLDDIDVLAAVKTWMHHSDKVLSTLSKMIFYRKLFKIELTDSPVDDNDKKDRIKSLREKYHLSENEANYFVFSGTISNQAYAKEQPIKILNKKGKLKDIAEASDQLNLQALSEPVVKHFICYPKKMLLA